MTFVKAVEAGRALSTVATKLYDYNIVAAEGYSVLLREAQSLKNQKNSLKWIVSIPREQGKIVFQEVKDSKKNRVYPTISCSGIEVDQRPNADHPFSALDIAIEIEDAMREPFARWHVDLANANERSGEVQSGPLYHLQYGGHNHGHRELDESLKVPRWCHPPMEVALICEVVAANFFPDEWSKLRQDPSWCEAIKVFEGLCYTAYLAKLSRSLEKVGTTALGSMWAETWR